MNITSWVLMGAGGVSFWVGGGALHEFAGMDRIIAEGAGVLAALVLVGAGAWIRQTAGLPLSKDE